MTKRLEILLFSVSFGYWWFRICFIDQRALFKWPTTTREKSRRFEEQWLRQTLFLLIHWGRDKMATNFLMTFSKAFSRMKIYEYWLRFHWSLFPRIKLTILQHWFRQWLGASQVTSHYLTQWWLGYWRIYASFGLSEWIHLNTRLLAREGVKVLWCQEKLVWNYNQF